MLTDAAHCYKSNMTMTMTMLVTNYWKFIWIQAGRYAKCFWRNQVFL